jgi:hemolysin III
LGNALSHGIGILFAIIASPVLIAIAVQKDNPGLVLTVAFYCFTMLMMFTFSTLYHAFQQPEVKKTLRIFDHISIFFLIGGSYGPYIVLFTSVETAFWFLLVQWVLILIGAFLKVFYTGQFRLLSSMIYLGLGCMVFGLGKSFWQSISSVSMYYLLLGGLFYIVGIYFYQNQKLKNNHLIWHFFVLFAAISIYVSVLYALV